MRFTEEGKALAAARTAAATHFLAGNAGNGSGISARPAPMPRWPLFLAALLVMAVLLWLERGTAQRAEA